MSVPISDNQTHNLLMFIRDELRKINALLTRQLKGESTFMADITTDLQSLKDAVTAETNQDAALAAAIDGAVSTMASGVAEIKALAQQIGTVANDPQMVRDLAAQLKTATETQASKLAALQAASGELASAVVANTPGDGNAPAPTGGSSDSSSGSTSSGSPSGDSGSPAMTSTTEASTTTDTAASSVDTGPTLDPSGDQQG